MRPIPLRVAAFVVASLSCAGESPGAPAEGPRGLCSKSGAGWAAVPAGAGEPARYESDRTHSPITAFVAARLRAIAARGPNANSASFIKVGDSLTDSYAVMACFAGERLDLAGHDEMRRALCAMRAADLGAAPSDCKDAWCQDARTAFNRKSFAAVSGSTAAGVLDGAMQRELAAARPRYALIQFGTNDATVIREPADRPRFAAFLANLDALADLAEGAGAIPILYTIPPYKPTRNGWRNVPTINLIVRGLAQARQVPLVDLHRELVSLPDHGLWDGVHLRVEYGGCVFTPAGLRHGHNVRNLHSMQALARAFAAVSDGAAALDADTPALAGAGSQTDPWKVTALPFVDTPRVPDGTWYYELSLAQPVRVRALALELAGASATVQGPSGASASDIVHVDGAAGTTRFAVQLRGATRGSVIVGLVRCENDDPTCR